MMSPRLISAVGHPQMNASPIPGARPMRGGSVKLSQNAPSHSLMASPRSSPRGSYAPAANAGEVVQCPVTGIVWQGVPQGAQLQAQQVIVGGSYALPIMPQGQGRAAGSVQLPIVSTNSSNGGSLPPVPCPSIPSPSNLVAMAQTRVDSQGNGDDDHHAAPPSISSSAGLEQPPESEDTLCQAAETVEEQQFVRECKSPTSAPTVVEIEEIRATFASELESLTNRLRGDMLANQEKLIAMIERTNAEHTTQREQLEKRLHGQQETLDQVAGTFLEMATPRAPAMPHREVDSAHSGGKGEEHRNQLLKLEAAVEDLRQEVAKSKRGSMSDFTLQDLRRDIGGCQDKVRAQEKTLEEAHATQQVIEKSMGSLYRGIEEITAAVCSSEQKFKEQLGELVTECEEREMQQRQAASDVAQALDRKLDDIRREVFDTLEKRSSMMSQGITDVTEKEIVKLLGEQMRSLEGSLDARLSKQIDGERHSRETGLADLRRWMEEWVHSASPSDAAKTLLQSPSGASITQLDLQQLREEVSELRSTCAEVTERVAEWVCKPLPTGGDDSNEQWKDDAAARSSPFKGLDLGEDLQQLREEVCSLRLRTDANEDRVVEIAMLRQATGRVAEDLRRLQEDNIMKEASEIKQNLFNRMEALEERAIKQETSHSAITSQILEMESEINTAAQESEVQSLEERVTRMEQQQQLQPNKHQEPRHRHSCAADRLSRSAAPPADRLSRSVDSVPPALTYLNANRTVQRSRAQPSAVPTAVCSGPAVLVAMASEALDDCPAMKRVPTGDTEKYSISSNPSTPRMVCRQLIPDDLLMRSCQGAIDARAGKRLEQQLHPSLAQLASAKDKIADLLAQKADAEETSPVAQFDFDTVRKAKPAIGFSPSTGGAQLRTGVLNSPQTFLKPSTCSPNAGPGP